MPVHVIPQVWRLWDLLPTRGDSHGPREGFDYPRTGRDGRLSIGSSRCEGPEDRANTAPTLLRCGDARNSEAESHSRRSNGVAVNAQRGHEGEAVTKAIGPPVECQVKLCVGWSLSRQLSELSLRPQCLTRAQLSEYSVQKFSLAVYNPYFVIAV
jgi:hypothetical protein